MKRNKKMDLWILVFSILFAITLFIVYTTGHTSPEDPVTTEAATPEPTHKATLVRVITPVPTRTPLPTPSPTPTPIPTPIPTPEPTPEPEPEPITPVEVYEPEAPGENMRYVGTYRVTGYDTCVQCCGKSDGITASGTYATAGRTVATGYEFDFGTVLYLEGIGYRVVEDRGVGNGSIDVVCEDHPACYAITGYYDVWIVEEESK